MCQPCLQHRETMITLRNVLKANAVSCIIFGLIFLIIPAKTAHFLSQTNPAPNLLISLIGIILIINGLHLVWASVQATHSKPTILYFSSNDFIWVALSIALIIGKVWITTPKGIAATLAIAMMVGVLGALQFGLLKKHLPNQHSR